MHDNQDTPLAIIVMGVSGSGKSSIGEGVAARLGVHFIEGDALHPASNVEKMSKGIPLTDEDRWPWLDLVGEALADQRADVIACSALRRAYRDRIRSHVPTVFFAHLQGSRELIADRLDARSHEFMPTGLLASELRIEVQPDDVTPLRGDGCRGHRVVLPDRLERFFAHRQAGRDLIVDILVADPGEQIIEPCPPGHDRSDDQPSIHDG